MWCGVNGGVVSNYLEGIAKEVTILFCWYYSGRVGKGSSVGPGGSCLPQGERDTSFHPRLHPADGHAHRRRVS